MSLSKYELQSRCKHIESYGHNWGFVFVRDGIKWRKQIIRDKQRELKEYRAELKAYQNLIKKMERVRIATKGENSQ